MTVHVHLVTVRRRKHGSVQSSLSSTMIDYMATRQVAGAHGIWPVLDQRALKKGVVLRQGDIRRDLL